MWEEDWWARRVRGEGVCFTHALKQQYRSIDWRNANTVSVKYMASIK